MNALYILLITAIITEALTEYLKTAVPKLAGSNYIYVATILVAAVVAFSTGANIFEVVGLAVNRYVGVALTAVLVSRGSNYIYDLVSKLGNVKKNTSEFEALPVTEIKPDEEAEG